MMKSLLIIAYGAPECSNEVVPFLQNLFAGKNVPSQRIDAAVQKYERYAALTGHYSPLNQECRKLAAGIKREFKNRHQDIQVYQANLYWHPLLRETFEQMHRDGITEASVFVTSAFSCNNRYSEALQKEINAPIKLKFIPPPNTNRLFLKAQTDALLTALAHNTLESGNERIVLFSAHSLPKSDVQCNVYQDELLEACRNIAGLCHEPFDWKLVFQSASGPTDRWLTPDITATIKQIAAEGRYKGVVVLPIGFFCENMETGYDLDCEAGQLCSELNLSYNRASTVGTDAKISRMIADYVWNGE
jgi:ferrochelatase